MKHCVNCETELLTPLDEYGDMREPLCLACFLSGEANQQKNADEIEELEEQIDEIEDEIGDLERQLDDTRRKLHELRAAGKQNKTELVAHLTA